MPRIKVNSRVYSLCVVLCVVSLSSLVEINRCIGAFAQYPCDTPRPCKTWLSQKWGFAHTHLRKEQGAGFGMLLADFTALTADKDPQNLHSSAVILPVFNSTRDPTVLLQVRGQTPGSLIR
jgi:hypothetical protein